MGAAAATSHAGAPVSRFAAAATPLLAAARLAAALLLLALLGKPGAAGAQQADVVAPDGQGDFASLAVPAPRGSIQQRHWLVVDPDPRGLACRDPAGRASIALRPGAIVETDGDAAALLLLQGRPWLRVRVRPEAIQRDSRRSERGRGSSCWVRANRAYLAPILPDALEAQQHQRPTTR